MMNAFLVLALVVTNPFILKKRLHWIASSSIDLILRLFVTNRVYIIIIPYLCQQKSLDDPVQHSRIFNVFLCRQDQISMFPKSHIMIYLNFSFVLFIVFQIA